MYIIYRCLVTNDHPAIEPSLIFYAMKFEMFFVKYQIAIFSLLLVIRLSSNVHRAYVIRVKITSSVLRNGRRAWQGQNASSHGSFELWYVRQRGKRVYSVPFHPAVSNRTNSPIAARERCFIFSPLYSFSCTVNTPL